LSKCFIEFNDENDAMKTQSNPTATNSLRKSGLRATIAHLGVRPCLGWLRRRSLLWLIVPAVAAMSFVAVSGSTAPNIPAIALSTDPLYATASGDKPVLALALSVEYPTVGAQYVNGGTTDNTYTNYDALKPDGYLGYYDAESCYTYNNAPTETPVAPQTAADYKRFDRSGPAIALTSPDTTMPTRTSRMCNNAFSGNFLNWASSSAVDMLRLALTGGDRYVDTPPVLNAAGQIVTPAVTILQRAMIPNGNPICMWNSSNFPAKQLAQNGGSSGRAYYGAVPTAMQTAATGDIWVGNTLNRIYFGTASGGSCTNTTSYTLGGTAQTSGSAMGAITNNSGTLPSGTTNCANENGTCTGFTGTQEIWYGANSSWKVAPASGNVSCNNATFGDPIVGTAKKCYYKTYSGTWTPPITAGLNSDGFFYSRVQVCNVDSAGVLLDSRDYDFCKKYPLGNYKPTGAIQKYSDQLRLAAFGYLLDQTASYNTGGRYGGVLRAPVKYVGGKTFDINGVDNTPTNGNPNREWDETSGVFNINPENDATFGKSGVTTYLNQFGRTGTAGLYKIYDPVGELHYEALRYLQGLSPSPAAISNITTAMYDGFPVSTTWTDPYAGRPTTNDYSCLKSNIVVIGDINTHDGGRLPTASATANVPDISYWRGIVQSFEKKQSTAYLDGQGQSRTTSNPNSSNGSVPSGAGTSQMMGSAYWAHTHDIRGTDWTDTTSGGPTKQRPGLRVKTFTFDVNEYGAQNNVSTRRNANQFFMASKYGGFEADPSNLSKNPYNTKGNPFYRDDLTTADKYVWEDTDTSSTRTGEANTYFLQSDARGVLKAFDDIFARASTAARSIAGGAIQSKNLVQAGNTIYQGTFDTSDWSGDLLAVPVSVSASNVVTISNTATWTAANRLSLLPTPSTTRNIVVGNVGATKNPVAAPFTWAGIEASLQTDLDKPAPASATDGYAQDRLNYLRGDKTKETTVFRKRNTLLGDIVNSGVVYSGTPSKTISSSTYASFFATNATRTPAVFVGANDGMLHSFNATTGDELFAYIPSWMGPKLAALTNKTYVNAHQSYVDGTPAVAEAQVGSAGTAADWKTVLVGGTGSGGKGVFALDVTNPAAFSASNVMWEFTHNDDPDMGNVVGRPQILKFRTSAANASAATYKWFAVVGSGVNGYAVANSSGNFGTGYPSLFLLDLAKPAGTAWSLGSNYYKISLPVNGDLNYLTTGSLTATKATGLVNFRAALGNAREVSQMYMGDLHGNLWKLDFSLLGIADWDITKLSPFQKGASAPFVPYPLYTARDAAGNAQPITMAPSIAYGPIANSSYVLFGTGKYLETADKGNTSQQSIYMVYDNGTSSGDTLVSPAVRESAVSGRARLKQGAATVSTGLISVPAFTIGRAQTNANTEAIRSGWYFDFPESGERQISSATVVVDTAVFGSLIPGASTTSGTCSAAGGSGNQYSVNIASGNGTFSKSSVGIMGEPLVAEVTNATSYTISDSTGRKWKTTTSQVIQQGAGGLATGGTVSTTVAAGRLSWRQIHNYQDLK
jgi:type IV pilus assembly protein PilY1